MHISFQRSEGYKGAQTHGSFIILQKNPTILARRGKQRRTEDLLEYTVCINYSHNVSCAFQLCEKQWVLKPRLVNASSFALSLSVALILSLSLSIQLLLEQTPYMRQALGITQLLFWIIPPRIHQPRWPFPILAERFGELPYKEVTWPTSGPECQ